MSGERTTPTPSGHTPELVIDINIRRVREAERDFKQSERIFRGTDINDFLKQTGDYPYSYEGLESPEQFHETIDETKLRVFEIVVGDWSLAREMADMVTVDFANAPLFQHENDYFEGIVRSGNYVEVLDYESGVIDLLEPEESVLPIIYPLKEGKACKEFKLIPSVPGAREFRRLDDEGHDRISDTDKLSLYIALGIAHIAVYKNDRLMLAKLGKEVHLPVEDLLGDTSRVINGVLNLGALPEKNVKLIDKYRFLWGIALEAAAGSDSDKKAGLINAILVRHTEEIPSYKRNTEQIDKLMTMLLIEQEGLSYDEATERIINLGLDSTRMRADQDSISELWMAAGQPIIGKELKQLFRKFFLRSID